MNHNTKLLDSNLNYLIKKTVDLVNSEEIRILFNQMPVERYERHNWFYTTFHNDLYDDEGLCHQISKETAYASAVKELVKLYGFSDDNARDKMSVFLREMFFRTFQDSSPRNITEQQQIFSNEVAGGKTTFRGEVFLDGLHSPFEFDLSITDDISILMEKAPGLSALKILFSTIGSSPKDVFLRLNSILHTIRLYKLAGVSVIDGHIYPDGFFHIPQPIVASPTSTPYYVQLAKEELPNFKKFCETLLQFVLSIEHNENRSFLSIALQRYSDALTRESVFEQRITSGISALEALFLKGEAGELRRRLGQRVTCFLDILNCRNDPEQVYKTVDTAYSKVRNKFVHGGMVKDTIDLEKMSQGLLEIVRICLVVWLQISEKKKEDFIDDLDKAIYNPKKRKIIRDSLDGVDLSFAYGDTTNSLH